MADQNKVLTVSVAAYNVEAYLAETLKSLIFDGMDALDIVVVDDGSKDGTLAVAREYERRYPESIRVIAKENGGHGSTINAALAVARGMYFQFLDGDDWFDTSALSGYIEALRHADSDAVISPQVRVWTGLNRTEVVDACPQESEGVHDFGSLRFERRLTSAFAFKTQLLRDAHLHISEHMFYVDNEYGLLPLRLVDDVLVRHEPLYCYRLGREGQSVSVKSLVAHRAHEAHVVFKILKVYAPKGIIDGEFPAKAYVVKSLAQMVGNVYRNHLLAAESISDAKSELIAFDRELARYPEVYEASARLSRKVRIVRSSRFLAFDLVGAMLRRSISKRGGVL